MIRLQVLPAEDGPYESTASGKSGRTQDYADLVPGTCLSRHHARLFIVHREAGG